MKLKQMSKDRGLIPIQKQYLHQFIDQVLNKCPQNYFLKMDKTKYNRNREITLNN